MSEFNEAGWLKNIEHTPMHAERMGAVINPFSIAVNSTDVLDNHRSFTGLMRRWQALAGDGNGSHFIIGRSEAQGMYQLCSILRDAKHLNEATCGFFRDIGGKMTPANLCTVGIVVHNAGQLEMRNGVWRLLERGGDGVRIPVGLDIPAIEVSTDPINSRRGYHLPTLWQLEKLQLLIRTLDAALPPIGSAKAVPRMGVIRSWADRRNARVVFHAALDPTRTSGPWPLIGSAVNQWYP